MKQTDCGNCFECADLARLFISSIIPRLDIHRLRLLAKTYRAIVNTKAATLAQVHSKKHLHNAAAYLAHLQPNKMAKERRKCATYKNNKSTNFHLIVSLDAKMLQLDVLQAAL